MKENVWLLGFFDRKETQNLSFVGLMATNRLTTFE